MLLFWFEIFAQNSEQKHLKASQYEGWDLFFGLLFSSSFLKFSRRDSRDLLEDPIKRSL